MEKKNSIILGITVAIVVLAIALVVALSSRHNTDQENIAGSSETSQTAQATERPIVKPTFYYFVTQKDEKYQAALEVFEKLKGEYEDRVNFELQDLDADPSLADNFSLVVGNTPALIMTNLYNDPSNFLFSTTDEAQLTDAITKALGE